MKAHQEPVRDQTPAPARRSTRNRKAAEPVAGGPVGPEQMAVLQRAVGNGAAAELVAQGRHEHHARGGHPWNADTASPPVQRLFKSSKGQKSDSEPAPQSGSQALTEPAPSVAVHPEDDPQRGHNMAFADPLAKGADHFLETVKSARKAGGHEEQEVRAGYEQSFKRFLMNSEGKPLENAIALRNAFISKKSLSMRSGTGDLKNELRGEVVRLRGELDKRKAADASQKMVPGQREQRVLHALRSGGASALAPEDLPVYNALKDRAVDWAKLHDIQAMSLILVEKRGAAVVERERAAAVGRFDRLSWFAPYKNAGLTVEAMLADTHRHLLSASVLMSNMGFGNPAEATSTISRLTGGPDVTFKNYWETRSSGGQATSALRGSREEHLGYKDALNRTQGRFQNPAPDDNHDRFSPPDPSLLPKYAALMSRNRPAGLSAYGEAAVHWKPGLRDRVTLTPIDSWQNGVGGARGVTGSRNLYPLLAHGPEQVVRLAVAEATSFRFDPEMKSQVDSGSVNSLQEYFEAQIHGPLNWADVERIVLNPSPWVKAQKAHLELFAQQQGLSIRVETR
ncbi:hypothetical protein AB0I49_24360 [Streptomyces sp. NPDC050617]|uniref:hypothetical protein n=1 Tax=Streptomyces sp. NPDC050617 TaxID=3154628 RepID=UPI00341D9647